MSRNSKNAQRTRQAKQWSAQRKSGGHGPAKTAKKHTKKNTWYAGIAQGRKPKSNVPAQQEVAEE